MPVVALNRRFVEWGDKEPPDPAFRHVLRLGDGAIGWDELLAKRRVVILAEAGSGKSTEIAKRARLLVADGKRAFHATVEDVGRDGLEAALSNAARADLAAWRASKEDAWFFIDSVDEAKAEGVRFKTVVRRLADGIDVARSRAHVILSGRITDWEFRKDLESLTYGLPILPDEEYRPAKTPEEELLRIIRQEQRKENQPSPEGPFVALMAPLDRERIRLFAERKGIPNLDSFLKQIEAANLWHFAQRPLDLEWLVSFWQNEKRLRLGLFAEMVERSVTERLKEKNKDRSRKDNRCARSPVVRTLS